MLICNVPGAQGLEAVELPKGVSWEVFCWAHPGASVMEYLMWSGVRSI